MLLLQRLSPNVKYNKFTKNFKIKISKICSTVFAYWHIDHACQFIIIIIIIIIIKEQIKVT